MKKAITLYLSICFCFICNAQNPEMVIQNGHVSNIKKIEFNNNGTYLASLAENNEIIIWDVRSGGQFLKFKPHQKITAFTFNKDNTEILLGTNKCSLIILDINTSKIKKIVDLKKVINSDRSIKYIYSLKFRDSENLIITSETEFILNINTLVYEPALNEGIITNKKIFFNNGLNEANIKGPRLIVQDRYSRDNIFQIQSIYLDKKFTSISASDSNHLLIAGNELGSIYIIDYLKGKIRTILEEHLRSVNDVAFSPDEAIFASASSDRSIIIWDIRNLKPIRRFYSRTLPIKKIALSSDGQLLAIGDDLGFLKVIDLSSNSFDLIYNRQHNQEITSINFLPGDSIVMTTSSDNKAFAYEIKSLKTIKKLKITKNLNFNIAREYIDRMYNNKLPISRLESSIITNDSNYLVLSGITPRAFNRSQTPFFPLTLLNIQTLKKDKSLFYRYQLPPETKESTSKANCLKAGLINNEFYNSTGNNLNHWVIKDQQLFYKSYEISVGDITKFDFLDENLLLMLVDGNLYSYDFKNITNVNANADVIIDFYIDKKTKQISIVDNENQIFLLSDLSSSLKITKLSSINNVVNDITFHPNKPWLISAHEDGSINFWDNNDGILQFTILPIGIDQKVIVTPENYYYSPRSSVNGIGYKHQNRYITFDQLDLQYNRPHIILAKLGYIDNNLISHYKKAYLKRLNKYRLDTIFNLTDLTFPEIKIPNKQNIPLYTNERNIEFQVMASDCTFELIQLNLFVNNVPYWGSNGIKLSTNPNDTARFDFKIPLSRNENKIEVSCQNSQGIESFRDNFIINCEIEDTKPNFYFIPICVSRYKQNKFNLKHTVKDGKDMQKKFEFADNNYTIHLENFLFDTTVTKENILGLKNKLLDTNVDDIIMLYLSGHGLLDENFDFYFATHDIDFDNPSDRGISYDQLEWLLDSIPARKKLFMMDACHSGEVDKEEIIASNNLKKKEDLNKGIKSYTYRAKILEEDTSKRIGLQNSFELMQELFTNLNRGSGAVVISAAAGDSYALESDEWNNGIFTYSVLDGLENKNADLNQNDEITVSELRDYVSKKVQEETGGRQKPTMRQENIEFDFRIW